MLLRSFTQRLAVLSDLAGTNLCSGNVLKFFTKFKLLYVVPDASSIEDIHNVRNLNNFDLIAKLYARGMNLSTHSSKIIRIGVIDTADISKSDTALTSPLDSLGYQSLVADMERLVSTNQQSRRCLVVPLLGLVYVLQYSLAPLVSSSFS